MGKREGIEEGEARAEREGWGTGRGEQGKVEGWGAREAVGEDGGSKRHKNGEGLKMRRQREVKG